MCPGTGRPTCIFASRSLSDLRIVGCEATSAGHFLTAFCPIVELWACSGSGYSAATVRDAALAVPSAVALRLPAECRVVGRADQPIMPLMPPMRFIIFIRPPPFIFFIMPCICSNWLSRRFTS